MLVAYLIANAIALIFGGYAAIKQVEGLHKVGLAIVLCATIVAVLADLAETLTK